MIKVSKKLERIARAMAYVDLTNNGMLQARGADFVHEKVNERWPSWLLKAEHLNRMMNMIGDMELDGYYDEDHPYAGNQDDE